MGRRRLKRNGVPDRVTLHKGFSIRQDLGQLDLTDGVELVTMAEGLRFGIHRLVEASHIGHPQAVAAWAWLRELRAAVGEV